MKLETKIQDHLTYLYGAEAAKQIIPSLEEILADFQERNPHLRTNTPADRVTEKDAILITYGDQILEENVPPLQSLTEVLNTYAKNALSGVHILPFFPYSSDDGFSIIDYTQVNPELGSWENIESLGKNFRLMFDAVINHISQHSQWFQGYLRNDPHYANYFITIEPGTDTSQVTRPRAKPLLTPVQTSAGEKLVWTTFSPDQIDLNLSAPEVFLEIIKILLLYAEKGADIIRLDAIAYAWKKLGTTCIHLEEVHRLIQLFRLIFNLVAPNTIILTETNVPHKENISYFGDGYNEAQMVYQFPLPPLTLHTFITGDSTHLSNWAADLEAPSEETTFFNFLASHDGIGVRPVEGILNQGETEAIIERVATHGGHISHKTNPDGSESVYELNISYFDALSDPNGGEPLAFQARRFLASQAIMLSLQGVPGIYVHSLFGSRNYHQGVEKTGHYRSINREKFQRSALESELHDPESLRHKVFFPYLDLLKKRAAHASFHPNGTQTILPPRQTGNKALFILIRTAPAGEEKILCVHNVSNAEQSVTLDVGELELKTTGAPKDIITGKVYKINDMGNLEFKLFPYQILWLAV